MVVETVEDLTHEIANWLGIYGSCKSTGDEGCEFDESKPFCCRVGFMENIENRMRNAVENDKRLEQAGLK